MSVSLHPQPQTDMPKQNRYLKALLDEHQSALTAFERAKERLELMNRLLGKFAAAQTAVRAARKSSEQHSKAAAPDAP